MQKRTYSIANMECANCAMILESIEDKLPGIKEINASYHKSQMTVEFDEKLVSETEILAAVQKKGYIVQQKINPRRKINFTLFTTREFIDEGKKSIESIPRTLNVDNEFIKYTTFLHSYNQTEALDFEGSLKYLKKAGIINE